MPEIPEQTASRTIEQVAQWLDQLARDSTDPGEQERLGALAEALRFDRTLIVERVTMR